MYIFACRVGGEINSRSCWYYRVSHEPRKLIDTNTGKTTVGTVSPAWKKFCDLVEYEIEGESVTGAYAPA